MKLFEFIHKYDFGHEYYIKIFFTRKFAIAQLAFDYSDFPGWPYLQITSGMGRFFSINVNVWRFGICLELLTRSWQMCYNDLYTIEELRNGN